MSEQEKFYKVLREFIEAVLFGVAVGFVIILAIIVAAVLL